MNGRKGDLGSTSMALTRESFWRYASSTCQRTSSDRLPTRRSSKFWGGRLLASRRCSASYKFVCCGRDRAWCSLGLPMVYWQPAPGAGYYGAAFRRGVAGSSSTPQGDRCPCRSSRALGEQIELARIGRFMDGAGLGGAPSRTPPRTRLRAPWTLSWRDSYCVLCSGSKSSRPEKQIVCARAARLPAEGCLIGRERALPWYRGTL